MSENHHHYRPENNRGLIFAVFINLSLTLFQFIGGILSGSLSLLADAVHNLSDAASLGIALFARKISLKPADEAKTFGYQRAEVIAALINTTLLITISLYLIYEAFLRLNGFENYELGTYCSYIRRTIKQWVGIPVSIGVSSTKTLSKIANNLAKKNKEYDGVCILKSWFDINEALKLTPIGDVWGIGRRLSSFLQKYNIKTAYDFIQLDKGWVRKNMGVVGEKTFLELCGVSCIELDLIPSDKKSCCVSRSFSKPIEKIYDLEESVSAYGTRVAEKIREEGLMAESMSVFVLTNYFNRKEKQYSNSIKLPLPFPTNNSIKIVKRALQGIRKIYREGYRYKKAGVILYGLSKSSQGRGLLDYDRESSDAIMNTMDRINGRYGSSVIRLASEGIEKSWRMKRERVSPCYTTSFDDLVEVKT